MENYRRYAIAIIPFLFVWIWSTGFVGARLGLPYIEPMYFLSIRFGATILCFWIMIKAMKAPNLNGSQILPQLIVGGLLHGGYLGGVFYAISLGTPAGISAIIVGLQPILTAVFGWLFLGARLSAQIVVGLVLGFVGLVAVVFGAQDLTSDAAGKLGLTMCILALLGITIATLYQKRIGQNTPLLSGSLWQYIGAFLVVAPLSFFFETHQVEHTWQLWVAILWAIFALSIVAVLLLMFMIREGEVAKVSSYFYLVPPAAVIQVWFLFGESLSWISVIGCFVVVFGVALVVRR